MVRFSQPLESITDEKLVLVSQSPSLGPLSPINLLSPSVRNTPGKYTAEKIIWLIDFVRQSEIGGSVVECSRCGQRLLGQSQVQKRNQHLTRHCRVTQGRPGCPQLISCPGRECGTNFRSE